MAEPNFLWLPVYKIPKVVQERVETDSTLNEQRDDSEADVPAVPLSDEDRIAAEIKEKKRLSHRGTKRRKRQRDRKDPEKRKIMNRKAKERRRLNQKKKEEAARMAIYTQ